MQDTHDHFVQEVYSLWYITSHVGGVAVNMSTFGMTVGGHFVLDNVNCTGNESNIFDCSHPLSNDCRVSRKEEAGVICGGIQYFIPLILFSNVKCYHG